LVVDEYGDLVGLITFDDVLQQIVGRFTSQSGDRGLHIIQKSEPQFIVKGRIAIRFLNRRLHWDLPTEEATTLNGLIIETIKDLPTPNLELTVDNYHMTILEVGEDSTINSILIERLEVNQD